MLVDPADLRFTQDSISLYFQHPHGDFSIRDAVRSISENEMTADDFPLIRVISHDGFLWSIDNRRLWVFRYARCKTISVRLQNRMHPRLSAIISNPILLRIMKGADFFPKVRDRGKKDRGFDHLYPQPSSFQPSRKSHFSVINVADEIAQSDIFRKLPKTQDQAWAFSGLGTGRPSSQAEVQEVVPNRTGKELTIGDYTDPLGAQSSSVQPLESHDYMINVADADAESEERDIFPNLSKTQDQARAFHGLGTGRPSSQVDIDKIFPNHRDKEHTNGGYTNHAGAQPSLVQRSESLDYMINVGQVQPENQYTCMTDVTHILSSSTDGQQTDDKIPSETDLAEMLSTSVVQVKEHNKAMSVTASPQNSPIGTAKEHGNKENTDRTASPRSPLTTLPEDHAQCGTPIFQRISNGFHNVLQSATRIIAAGGAALEQGRLYISAAWTKIFTRAGVV